MEDRSNVQQNWFAPGTRIELPSGDILFDALIRWNERTTTREGEGGKPETEYIYDAQRVDTLLPVGKSQAEHLESIKADLLPKVINGEKISQERIKVAQGMLNSQYLEKLSAESFKVSDRVQKI